MKIDYKKLTLESIVYHPFFGEGTIESIGTDYKVVVKFKDVDSYFDVNFKYNVYSITDRTVNELFDKPVKIVDL